MRLRHATALAFSLLLAAPTASLADDAACDDAIVARVLLHAHAPPGGRVRASACAPLGGPRGLVAVAVAYEPKDYDGPSGPSLPVHVAWFDARAQRVVASTHADIAEDAVTRVTDQSFEWKSMPGLGRPAAALVVNDFTLQSAMDGDYGPEWTLFVADGPRLQAVAGPTTLWFARCDRACRDSDESQRQTKRLSFAPAGGLHHGLRDLDARLTDSTTRKPTHLQLVFDGRRYRPDIGNVVVP